MFNINFMCFFFFKLDMWNLIRGVVEDINGIIKVFLRICRISLGNFFFIV